MKSYNEEKRFLFTFEYIVDNQNVCFDGRLFYTLRFKNFIHELNFESRSEGTKFIDKRNQYGADYYLIAKDGTVLIPAEIYCIYDILINKRNCPEVVKLIHFNRYFDYFVCDDYLYMIDSDKTRFGSWYVPDLLKHGVPSNLEKEDLPHGGELVLKFGKNVLLTGQHVGMGFSISEYKRFLKEIQLRSEEEKKG